MKKVTDLTAKEAKEFFLKGSSYFNTDLPNYISFEPVLNDVRAALGDGFYSSHKSANPDDFQGVNYSFVSNKDGRFAWRPFELIHPALYVSLVNLVCAEENWQFIVDRFAKFQETSVKCCSYPAVSTDSEKDKAAQIKNWWKQVEQQSLALSLCYTHILHTDVTDCYGSLYTHSISWALHGLEEAKKAKGKGGLLGDRIDSHIRAGRYGQTNGIPQGSGLMDFVAEMVLGYADELITHALDGLTDYQILRYRDDYRVFTNSDVDADRILKAISDALRTVGMKLGASKTFVTTNVVEGSIKPDKLAGIELQDLGVGNAHTIQKQLLRLHSFGRKFPNSGALRRLVGEFHAEVVKQKIKPDDLEVQVAIATDIAVVSPSAFPAVAGILSHMISLEPKETKKVLWDRVYGKLGKVPHNGYMEVWLQRVTKPKAVGIVYASEEQICKVVNGNGGQLWNSDWIANKTLVAALDVSKIVVHDAAETAEVISAEEIELFNLNAAQY